MTRLSVRLPLPLAVQISVERQVEYTDLPVEAGGRRLRVPTSRQRLALLRRTAAASGRSDAVVPRGEVNFKSVTVRYRPGLPAALRQVSLRLPAGQKVGVVGRTGAGKSTLLSVLWRMVPYSGLVTIDGTDIARVGLRALRSAMAIVPQVRAQDEVWSTHNLPRAQAVRLM